MFVSDCTVTVSGPKPNKKCAFPFKLGRKIYRSCTDRSDPGKFWCSTKTDRFGKHVAKNQEWGYCHPSCNGKKPASTSKPDIITSTSKTPIRVVV